MNTDPKPDTQPKTEDVVEDKPFDPWETKFRSHYTPSSTERANRERSAKAA